MSVLINLGRASTNEDFFITMLLVSWSSGQREDHVQLEANFNMMMFFILVYIQTPSLNLRKTKETKREIETLYSFIMKQICQCVAVHRPNNPMTSLIFIMGGGTRMVPSMHIPSAPTSTARLTDNTAY